jgi:hypothetical protein
VGRRRSSTPCSKCSRESGISTACVPRTSRTEPQLSRGRPLSLSVLRSSPALVSRSWTRAARAACSCGALCLWHHPRFGHARVRPVWPALDAVVTLAARVRLLGGAGWFTLPPVADHASGARGEAFAAALLAFHPHLPRVPRHNIHVALAALGTGRLLTVGSVDARTQGDSFIEADTALALRAPARLARG